MNISELLPKWFRDFLNKPKNIAFILFCLVFIQSVSWYQYLNVQNAMNALSEKRIEFYKEQNEALNKKYNTKMLPQGGISPGGGMPKHIIQSKSIDKSTQYSDEYKNVALRRLIDSLDSELVKIMRLQDEARLELRILEYKALREFERQKFPIDSLQLNQNKSSGQGRDQNTGSGAGSGGGKGSGSGPGKGTGEAGAGSGGFERSESSKSRTEPSYFIYSLLKGNLYLYLIIFLGVLEIPLIFLFIRKVRS